MQHLVFWPHAGAWGAGVILLPPCVQLLWCELYVMKSTQENEKKMLVLVCELHHGKGHVVGDQGRGCSSCQTFPLEM